MNLLCVLPTDIMFSKYFWDYAIGERGGNTPPARSPKGTPASSGSIGKRPISPPVGAPSEGPAKRIRTSSLGTPPSGSSRPSATPPPPPPFKEEKGISPQPSRSSLGGCISILLLHRTKGKPPLWLFP
ncbi:UNVERIFIED_CONTAM: hypothetical protein Sradi_6952300 [Sesamum radiatum]|uniref:Uncharacterized protein n=1 Tax=Sesamum radiatum TaxID=300843 RepID=A0AAW2JHY9_SESRA